MEEVIAKFYVWYLVNGYILQVPKIEESFHFKLCNIHAFIFNHVTSPAHFKRLDYITDIKYLVLVVSTDKKIY